MVATARATAGFPYHHALSYRTSLETPLATAAVIAVAAHSDNGEGR